LDIGCTCFNFAAGFVNEHTDGCYCQYDAVMYNVQLFKKFYTANKDTRFAFKSTPATYTRYDKWSDDKWMDDKWYKKYNGTTKDNKTSAITVKDVRVQTCSYCGLADSATWDMYGNPLCDDCSYDIFGEEKTCEYCGMDMYKADDHPERGELEDEIFDGICVSCASWLRDNMDDMTLQDMNIKLKSDGERIR